MKRVWIGTALMACGTAIDGIIILSAAIYSSSLHSWSGSKLWYAIFGTMYDYGANLSLNLWVPFVLGAVLLLCGILALAIEYFKKQ